MRTLSLPVMTGGRLWGVMVELGHDLGFTAKAFDEFGFLGQGI
jgi:hypothetical protein